MSSPAHHHHASHPATLAAVALGGAAGAMLRWGVELAMPVGGSWPWATLLSNVVGCAALAWLVVHAERHAHPAWIRPGLGTGLLGGFTTFSTYAVQVATMAQGDPLSAVGYLVATPVLCVLSAGLAWSLARSAARRGGQAG